MILVITISKEFCQHYCFYSPSQHVNQSYGCSLSVEIIISYSVLLSSGYHLANHGLFLTVSDFPKRHQIPVYTKVRLGTAERDRTNQTIISSAALFEVVLFSAPTQQTPNSPCSLSQAALVVMVMHSSNAAHCSSGCCTLQVK